MKNDFFFGFSYAFANSFSHNSGTDSRIGLCTALDHTTDFVPVVVLCGHAVDGAVLGGRLRLREPPPDGPLPLREARHAHPRPHEMATLIRSKLLQNRHFSVAGKDLGRGSFHRFRCLCKIFKNDATGVETSSQIFSCHRVVLYHSYLCLEVL